MITSPQRQAYREQGFLVLRNAFDEVGVRKLAGVIQRVIDRGWAGELPGVPMKWIDYEQKIPDFIPDLLAAKYDPAFGAWLDAAIIPAAEALLEAPVRCSWLTLCACGGGYPYSVNWHRDTCRIGCATEAAILARDLHRQCYLQAPLFPDSYLQVVPGSHARPATAEEVAVTQAPGGPSVDVSGGVPVNCQPGDVVFRHGNIIHRGWNPHGAKRWTLISNFWRADVPLWGNEARDRDTTLASSDQLARMSPRTRTCVQRFLDAYCEDHTKDVWET